MKKQLLIAVCLAAISMTGNIYATDSDYIAVNPQGKQPTATGAA